MKMDKPTEEEEGKDPSLRDEIAKVMHNTGLTQAEKSAKIQQLMTQKWTARQVEEVKAESTQLESEKMTPEEITRMVLEHPSYNDPERKILGCKHYARDCLVRAKCCGLVFPCRLCHDEHVKGHKIDRYATEEIVCGRCGTLQPVSNACISEQCNGKPFGKWYCAECRFWENSNRDIYHCPKCNVCRVGKGLGIDRMHCDTCGCCYSIDAFRTHKCMPNKLGAPCSVCQNDMLYSREPAIFMQCGHCIHVSCCRKLIESGNIKCPLCSRSIIDQRYMASIVDRMKAENPTPEEFAHTEAEIFCNDCHATSRIPFNFVALQCPHCLSYNTARQRLFNFPDEKALEALRARENEKQNGDH